MQVSCPSGQQETTSPFAQPTKCHGKYTNQVYYHLVTTVVQLAWLHRILTAGCEDLALRNTRDVLVLSCLPGVLAQGQPLYLKGQ